MTGKEFDKLFEDQVTECRSVMTTKGSDYTDNLDRLSNFKVVGAMIGVDPKIVWAVFAAKHFLAIMNYCGRGKVESEAIEGRFTDLINYGHLGKALVVEDKQTPEPHEYDLWLAEQQAAEVSEQCLQTSAIKKLMEVMNEAETMPATSDKPYIGEMDATKLQSLPTFPEDINGYVDILKSVPPHDTPLTMSSGIPYTHLTLVPLTPAEIKTVIKSLDPAPSPEPNLWERLKQLASS